MDFWQSFLYLTSLLLSFSATLYLWNKKVHQDIVIERLIELLKRKENEQ